MPLHRFLTPPQSRVYVAENEKIKDEYMTSPARHCPPLSVLLPLAIAICLVELPLDIYESWRCMRLEGLRSTSLILAQCVLRGIACCLLVAHCARRIGQVREKRPNVFQDFSVSHLTQLGFCLTYSLSSLLHLLVHALGRHADTVYVILGENHNGVILQSPVSMAALSVLITPLIFGSVFAEALGEWVLLFWAASLAILIVAAVLIHSAAFALVTGYSFFLLALVFYCTQKASVALRIKQRQEIEQALGQHDQNMKHIIANLAHDLKTPLASFMAGVELFTELLDEAIRSVPSVESQLHSAQECLQNIRNTNNFMIMTINRCIDYTKAAKGLKLIPKIDSFNLIEALSLPLLCMKDIQQKVIIELEPLPVEISEEIFSDQQWLQENLLCLLSNAVKYSSGGKVTLAVRMIERPQSFSLETYIEDTHKVQVSVSRGSSITPFQLLRFEVEDCGIGMSDDAMQHLFSPFRQNQRLAGGTGLGLFSLAKRMEALQGQCGVMRRRDGKQGSLFWFAFPYRPDESKKESCPECEQQKKSTVEFVEKINSRTRSSSKTASVSFASSHQHPKPLPSPAGVINEENKVGGNHTVLLVDDSPSIVKITTMLLRRQGFTVFVAENGADALDLIQNRLNVQSSGEGNRCSTVFDVILMDLQMPVMDGLEAVRRLRTLEGERCRHLVVGLSANSDEEIQQEVWNCGFDAFLTKPFSQQAFLQLFRCYYHDEDLAEN